MKGSPLSRLSIQKGDITTYDVDAIVNAANSSLMGGGGVDGAIHRKGGPVILEECKAIVTRQGNCPTGEAVITSAGNLPSKYVIHTVGPIWKGGSYNEEHLLKMAYTRSLQLAADHHFDTIAFPNISTGVYHFPKENAARIAIETTLDFLRKNENPSKVVFVCFDLENYDIYMDLLTRFE